MKHREEWDYIREFLELKPGIKTLSDYNAAIQVGEQRAVDFFQNLKRTVYYSEHIRIAHELVFRDVHPWAGEFRREEVEIGGESASVPKYIAGELHMLAQHAEKWFEATTIKGKASAIAAYHTAFEQIHPFLDGNGRVGRLILASQAEKELGCLIDLAAQKRDYYLALRTADKEHDLLPLRDLIIDKAQLREQMLNQEACIRERQELERERDR